MFGESADSINFTSQSQATNIQPSSWDSFMHYFYATFGDMGDVDDTDDEVDKPSEDEIDTGDSDQMIDDLGKQTPNTVSDKPPVLPDKEMAPVDQTVTPEIFQKKKQKSKARVSDDKQTTDQSTTAKPDAQTSAKKPQQKGEKSPDKETNYIMTGYEAVREEHE
ncbi:hypothetical protein C1646_788595 [Rhizophagus diaphanus]|nr:hypothetical protein C1646_788595 [Rhizophagus diaphanus] [Rhizophagus sp. MUCL 43196]